MIEIVRYTMEIIQTRYLHLRRRHVGVEETVSRGQRIRACGSTGRSTAHDLHFEVRIHQHSIFPVVLEGA